MRIQHNITAMSAYRNYNNNTSALSKNLEKLSSGYKINRAGDDAAGLAISEKMRAQITGLETAQKNAKDGISLVQTAEGAMTEVHDMLNRMVELASQSANGTYDDDVDRAQMQKELDELRDEINRIADSSNFNGIKLLDGSLDTAADMSTKVDMTVASKFLPDVGKTLGTDTVLHSDAQASTTGTVFSVDLHDVLFDNKEGSKLTIDVGGTKIELAGQTGNTGKIMDANAIVSALVPASNTGEEISNVTGIKWDATNSYATATINNQLFKVEQGTGGSGRLTFTQISPPNQESEEVDGSMIVKVSGTGVGSAEAGGTPAVKATYGFKLAPVIDDPVAGEQIKVGDEVVYTAASTDSDTEAEAMAKPAVKQKIAEALGKLDAYKDDWDVSYDAENDAFVFTAKKGGTVGTAAGNSGPDAAPAANTLGTQIKYCGADGDEITTGFDANATAFTDNDVTGAEKVDGSGVIGTNDFNVSTTAITNVYAGGGKRLASTHFQLTSDMIEEGAKINIGGTDYVFGKTQGNGQVKIDDLDADDADYLSEVARRLTDAAKANTVWTVGHDGSRMTFTEIEGQTNYDMKKLSELEKSFGYTGAAKTGSGLKLQIGDTADSFNQLNVNIKDMHTSSMGNENKSIKDISIATQKDATEAVDVIKSAINYVSDVRGTLGATQNRLDHTMNNLSVMQENIQDAESTIRDVDVAEEMMEYTKNNILVQSAQAMLAQANQLPQGVLQLLQ